MSQTDDYAPADSEISEDSPMFGRCGRECPDCDPKYSYSYCQRLKTDHRYHDCRCGRGSPHEWSYDGRWG